MGHLFYRYRSDGRRHGQWDLERIRRDLAHLQGQSVALPSHLSLLHALLLTREPGPQCADTIGILPQLDERVSWLPVDYAAKSIAQFVDLPTPAGCPVYHVMHATRVLWSAVLDALGAARVQFKAVPRHDWLKALRASDPDERRNPSRKLLAFYESKYGAEETTRAGLYVNNTLEASRWLREPPVVGEGMVAKWVGGWRESGFLPRI